MRYSLETPPEEMRLMLIELEAAQVLHVQAIRLAATANTQPEHDENAIDRISEIETCINDEPTVEA